MCKYAYVCVCKCVVCVQGRGQSARSRLGSWSHSPEDPERCCKGEPAAEAGIEDEGIQDDDREQVRQGGSSGSSGRSGRSGSWDPEDRVRRAES